jgi:S-adenosylmethionine:tRNA ribosyltransferase-isomerase
VKTEDFEYNLPLKSIAQNPPQNRGESRLLVLDRKTGNTNHRHYYDIPTFIDAGDVIVLNRTKVVWARIFPVVKRTGRNIEVLFLKNEGENNWYCLVGRARHVKIGDILEIGDYKLKILNRRQGEAGFVINAPDVYMIMKKHGHVPLPPYIKRKDIESDKVRYNTVFAENEGSVAAPTASLNLTDKILDGIKNAGGKIGYIDLDVGWGTFAPINTENVEDFDIHSEKISVGKDVVDLVNNCKGRVWAFGTTVVRALESVADDKGRIKEFCGETDLFIYPGYKFKTVDVLVTNFHASKTSLITLVSAFAGVGNIKHAYREALKSGYKFLSYGDSMLVT